jgi:diguanylate cyclase
VQVGEARLETATKVAREQRQRLQWVGFTAASYALDLLFLALYWLAGSVTLAVPLAYAAAAAVHVGGNHAAYASGWNLRFRDPSLTAPLVLAGVTVQLGLVVLAPQVAFPFIVNIFTVFAFGAIWMSLRASIAVWALTLAACGAVLWALGARTAVPAESPAEVVLTWLCFSLILGRCLLLSVYANALRAKVAEGRRRLAASLEQVQELVHYDELTRTLNRRSLIGRLEQEIGRARRSGAPFSVAMLDLDHFKAINDTYGHAVGDEVLRQFTATVSATMRETDVFGRYGGEEFLLLLLVSDPRASLAPLERIRLAVALHDWEAVVPGLALTTSIGVAGLLPEETVAQLLRRADEALYEAKAAGRNRVVIKE